MNWEKLISSDRATLKNLKKFFVNWEKREYRASVKHSKNLNFEFIDELGKVEFYIK